MRPRLEGDLYKPCTVRMEATSRQCYNFADNQPVGWVDARFDPTGADLTLRAFGGNLAGNGKLTRVDWR